MQVRRKSLTKREVGLSEPTGLREKEFRRSTPLAVFPQLRRSKHE